jgi:hypothetical protein
MDWAIEKNREALKGIVAALVAMAGLVSFGCGPATLPRHLHRAILRLLRPAESAVRRLAIVLARRSPPLPDLRLRKPAPPKARKASSLLVRNGLGTGIVLRRGAPFPQYLAHLAPAKAAPRPFSFPLLDPLPRWRVGRRWQPAAGVPRITMAGVTQRVAVPAWRPPLSDDPLDAGRLGRRLTALSSALDDLPGWPGASSAGRRGATGRSPPAAIIALRRCAAAGHRAGAWRATIRTPGEGRTSATSTKSWRMPMRSPITHWLTATRGPTRHDAIRH